MKNFTKHILILALGFSAFIGHFAQATQYEVLVTHSVHVSPSQAALGTLVQKEILIDTAKKTLSLELSNICKSGASCSEMLHTSPFKITQFSQTRGSVSSIVAQGMLTSNGHPVATTIQMSLNADNAMNITITNSTDCKAMHSDFIGSPAKTASFFVAE